MKTTRYFLITGLLVWSYFARPIYENAWIAIQRLREQASEKSSARSPSIPYDDVVALNTHLANELSDYLSQLRDSSTIAPEIAAWRFDSTNDYAESTTALREKLRQSLHYPPPAAISGNDFSGVTTKVLGEDDLATYTLLAIPALPGVHSTGVLILPKKRSGKIPLIIAAHGRGGMPDKPSSGGIPIMRANNRDLAHGAIERGWAVFEPIFVFYARERPTELREILTVQAQEAGTTLPAIEISKTIRAIDYLTTRSEIDANKIAMIGISYGGFNALYTTALDPRIKVASVAAYFNDREEVLTSSEPFGFLDWRFSNSLRLFRDETLAALVCPRPLQIQAGTADPLFPIAGARKAAALARPYYAKLGVEAHFDFTEFVGRHDFNGEKAWNFIASHWSDEP